jgi:hypothetical protein
MFGLIQWIFNLVWRLVKSALVLVLILAAILVGLSYWKEGFADYVKEGLLNKIQEISSDSTQNTSKDITSDSQSDQVELDPYDELDAKISFTQEYNQQKVKTQEGRYLFKYIYRNNQERPIKWEWSFAKSEIDKRALEFGLPEDFFERRYSSESEMNEIIRKGYFAILDDRKVYPDYPRLARRNRVVATPFYKMLRLELGDKPSMNALIESMLRFCQDIPYQQPPANEYGKFINGLDTPARMLLKGKGDCDTKSIVFVSTLLHDKRFKMLFVMVTNPDHMFVGIRGVPNPYQASITYQGEKYIVCEPVGEARLKMGQLAFKNCQVTHILPVR